MSKDEYVILKNIDKKYQCIARDKDKNLYIYDKKPIKKNECWDALRNMGNFELFNHLFQFIKWEDEEPRLIEDLLKCEVIEDE